MSALLPAVPVLIQLSRIAADAGVEHLEAGRMEAAAELGRTALRLLAKVYQALPDEEAEWRASVREIIHLVQERFALAFRAEAEAQAGPDRLHGAALILPDGTAFYGSGK
jgi:hypothetical protein